MDEKREQAIQEVVSSLQEFAHLYGIKSIFIAGGYCRQHYLGEIWKTKDIDVASAYHDQARQLGGLFASEIAHSMPTFYERTGTAMVEYPSKVGAIRVEFQGNSINSYMYNQDIRTWLQASSIENVPLMNNLYGRDFTMNALIYSLHNGNMYDPTQLAVKDLEDKIIRSLLPAKILIKYNPLASIRAIRFSLENEFSIDSDLQKAIKEDAVSSLQKSVSQKRIVSEIVKVLKINAEKGLELLKKLDLDRILLDPAVKEYIYMGDKKHVGD
jgi:tRNA nucleotidyltransferase/poly(A) polymerase